MNANTTNSKIVEDLMKALGVSQAEAQEIAAGLPPFALAAWDAYLRNLRRTRACDALRRAHPAVRRLVRGVQRVQIDPFGFTVSLSAANDNEVELAVRNRRYLDCYIRDAIRGLPEFDRIGSMRPYQERGLDVDDGHINVRYEFRDELLWTLL